MLFPNRILWTRTALVLPVMALLGACGGQTGNEGGAGFCSPGNPVIGQSAGFGDGKDCDSEQQAKANAVQDWVSQKCTGNNDPQCPSGCPDPNKECVTTATYDASTMTCQEVSGISRSICQDQTRWECTLSPTQTEPATCTCDCV